MNDLIKVCAWCYPGDSIFNHYPHWGGLGLRLSHGICAAHAKSLLHGNAPASEETATLDEASHEAGLAGTAKV